LRRRTERSQENHLALFALLPANTVPDRCCCRSSARKLLCSHRLHFARPHFKSVEVVFAGRVIFPSFPSLPPAVPTRLLLLPPSLLLSASCEMPTVNSAAPADDPSTSSTSPLPSPRTDAFPSRALAEAAVVVGEGSTQLPGAPTAAYEASEPPLPSVSPAPTLSGDAATPATKEDQSATERVIGGTKDFGFLPIPRRLQYDSANPPHFGLLLNAAFGFWATFSACCSSPPILKPSTTLKRASNPVFSQPSVLLFFAFPPSEARPDLLLYPQPISTTLSPSSLSWRRSSTSHVRSSPSALPPCLLVDLTQSQTTRSPTFPRSFKLPTPSD
jgi:hypothetical protein